MQAPGRQLDVTATRSARRAGRANANRLFAELDAKIEAGMEASGIPGVAVGVLYGGWEYLKGYGVTNVDHLGEVDPDTVFRVGSTTKVFTGTTVMRLVEQGKLDLNARGAPLFARVSLVGLGGRGAGDARPVA